MAVTDFSRQQKKLDEGSEGIVSIVRILRRPYRFIDPGNSNTKCHVAAVAL